jgi:hypothetical protein
MSYFVLFLLRCCFFISEFTSSILKEKSQQKDFQQKDLSKTQHQGRRQNKKSTQAALNASYQQDFSTNHDEVSNERACDSILSLDKLFAQVLQILLVSSTVAVSSDKDLHLSLCVSEAFHKMFA